MSVTSRLTVAWSRCCTILFGFAVCCFADQVCAQSEFSSAHAAVETPESAFLEVAPSESSREFFNVARWKVASTDSSVRIVAIPVTDQPAAWVDLMVDDSGFRFEAIRRGEHVLLDVAGDQWEARTASGASVAFNRNRSSVRDQDAFLNSAEIRQATSEIRELTDVLFRLPELDGLLPFAVRSHTLLMGQIPAPAGSRASAWQCSNGAGVTYLAIQNLMSINPNLAFVCGGSCVGLLACAILTPAFSTPMCWQATATCALCTGAAYAPVLGDCMNIFFEML